MSRILASLWSKMYGRVLRVILLMRKIVLTCRQFWVILVGIFVKKNKQEVRRQPTPVSSKIYHEKTSTQTRKYNTVVPIYHIANLCGFDTSTDTGTTDVARRSPWVSGRCGL